MSFNVKNPAEFSGGQNLVVDGTLTLKADSTTTTSTQIPVFTADPVTTEQTLVTRTPAQLLSDIGAISSTAIQTITGIKTFSSTIVGSITGSAGSAGTAGSAGSVTNGVYTTDAQTISGIKTFTGGIDINTDNIQTWSIRTGIIQNEYWFMRFYGAEGQYYDLRSGGSDYLNFTGQHRSFIKDIHHTSISGEYVGLIVCANQNTNISMSGSIKKGNQAITQNETLPYVSISTKNRDKSCFGVISASEDPNERVDKYGAFCTPFKKEKGDTRIYINSVGEGALWVTNKNGSLESGDYITTCDLSGYGMKQDDDILHNYTVAKITMDCDFNPVYQPVPAILKDSSGVNILEHDQIQWTDLVDSSGNIVYEYAYNIRYLNASAEIIDKETYDMSGGFIAAYVGCTYHCG